MIIHTLQTEGRFQWMNSTSGQISRRRRKSGKQVWKQIMISANDVLFCILNSTFREQDLYNQREHSLWWHRWLGTGFQSTLSQPAILLFKKQLKTFLFHAAY